MSCVTRTLKDGVGVPLAAIRQIFRLALGSMLQLLRPLKALLEPNLHKFYSTDYNFGDIC